MAAAGMISIRRSAMGKKQPDCLIGFDGFRHRTLKGRKPFADLGMNVRPLPTIAIHDSYLTATEVDLHFVGEPRRRAGARFDGGGLSDRNGQRHCSRPRAEHRPRANRDRAAEGKRDPDV